MSGLVVPKVAQCSSHVQASAADLQYIFIPVRTHDGEGFRVTVQFRGGALGRNVLRLPRPNAGQNEPVAAVRDLKSETPDASIVESTTQYTKQIRYKPRTTVRYSCELVKNWTGDLNGKTRFNPDITASYFHFIGTAALVYPDFGDRSVISSCFDFTNVPSAWSVATSFGTDRLQTFHGTLHDTLNSLFVGGNYRVSERNVNGNRLVFAIRGNWSFSDERWIEAVSKIVMFERSFWHDENFPYLLITLTPLDQDVGNRGGTALTNAFMIHVAPKNPSDPQS